LRSVDFIAAEHVGASVKHRADCTKVPNMILDLGEKRRCSHRHSIAIKDRDDSVFANKRAFRVVWQQEATGTLRHFAAASVGPAQSATMPPGQAFLVGVIVPVINSRNSAEASADMIQHLRADLQSDMQPSHAGSSSPSRPEPGRQSTQDYHVLPASFPYPLPRAWPDQTRLLAVSEIPLAN
jgi:hypothetical protein